jgi:hypothetical protein
MGAVSSCLIGRSAWKLCCNVSGCDEATRVDAGTGLSPEKE